MKEENRLPKAHSASFRLREVELMPVMSQEEVCPILKQYFDFLEQSLSGQHDSIDIGLLQEMLLEIALLLRSGKGLIREDGYLRLLNRLTSIYSQGLWANDNHAFSRTASSFADILETISQQFQDYDYSPSVSLLLHYMHKLFNSREESWLDVYEHLLSMPDNINVMKLLRDEHMGVVNTWIEEGVDNLFTLREEQLDLIDIQSNTLQDLEQQIETRQSLLQALPLHQTVVPIERAIQLREIARLNKQRQQLIEDQENKREIVGLLDTNITEFSDRLAQMRRSTLIKLV